MLRATAKTPPGQAGPPPARIALRKRRGAPGRSQELPAPAWARRHTGRNVPSSAGPPSACRLPHPGIAECNPRAGGGCSQQEQQVPPITTSLHFAFVHKRDPRKPGCVHANLEVSMYPGTQGTNYSRPAGVAHHAQGSPTPSPRLTQRSDAHSSEGQVGRAKSGISIICKYAPPPSRSLQTPRAAHTHRLASSPPPHLPAPQHLSPGMPWEVQQASLCRH